MCESDSEKGVGAGEGVTPLWLPSRGGSVGVGVGAGLCECERECVV